MANWVTRARLVTLFCHGAIVIRGDLYHVTTTKGVHCLKAGEWEPEKWDLSEDIDTERDDARLALFEQYKGAKYDWFSLLAFVGIHAKNDRKVYCFEFVHIMFHLINIGQAVPERITPEVLYDNLLEYLYLKKSSPHGAPERVL